MIIVLTQRAIHSREKCRPRGIPEYALPYSGMTERTPSVTHVELINELSKYLSVILTS